MALQVREADISRLSFAVEIAEEFYGRFAISLLLFLFSFQASTLTFLLFLPSLFPSVPYGVLQSEGNAPFS
jgi:hypothetical protein